MGQLVILNFIFLILASCSGGRNTISERPLVEATRGKDSKPVEIREIKPETAKKEFYVKEKELSVKSKRPKNSSGSLSSVDDARSYVLPSALPVVIGTVLDIKVASNRLETPTAASGAPSSAAAKSSGQLEETLIKSLPELEQSNKAKDGPVVIKNFKAQVIDVRDNGDVVIAYHRTSIRADYAEDLMIRAVVPNAALTDRDNITTDRLEDVHIRESKDGELVERTSSNWEDEYTLRMSGFDEAKSKSAIALEDKKRQLQESKEKVIAQIKSLGVERQSMTKERQELLDSKKKDEESISKLEAKVKDQESELEKLRPKDEEADAKKAEEAAAAKEGDQAKLADTPKAKKIPPPKPASTEKPQSTKQASAKKPSSGGGNK